MKDEKEYLRRHWILWNWLAEHSECKNKYVAFKDLGWMSDDEIDNPIHHCYLCELFNDYHGCLKCPLRKASGLCDVSTKPNHYDHWSYARTDESRRKYALLVRDVVPKPEEQP